MTSVSLPIPVHQRLDELVQAAATANSTRAEVIAMLIATAKLDPDELVRRLLDYRVLTVGDVLGASEHDNVVVGIHGPGRRKGGTGD
jgi:hypothetical protein